MSLSKPMPSPGVSNQHSQSWKWTVCSLLLFATMLNYMDRQTLSLTITDISDELGLNNEQYGEFEMGFGLAFATGAIVVGLLVDYVSVRWLYPLMILGWSAAGIEAAFAPAIGGFVLRHVVPLLPGTSDGGTVTASSAGYTGLMICRIALGFFEAGHWPCALVTTQRILTRGERSLGNSLLQSGAAFGAIITPVIVQFTVSDQSGTWRRPFVIIGLIGSVWLLPWLLTIRQRDLDRPEEPISDGLKTASTLSSSRMMLRYVALIVTVVMINMTWQYFRVWLPKFLREFHEYDRTAVNAFTFAYYVATDAGCILSGVMARLLVRRGLPVHRSRMLVFLVCAMLCTLSVVAADQERGPLLLGLLLLIGFGALGLFPQYYSFTQDLSTRRQGLIAGSLGAITWVVTSIMQKYIGRAIDETESYALGISAVGFAPVIACVALALLWGRSEDHASEA